MNKMLLNSIIGFSVVGLLVIGVKDYLVQKRDAEIQKEIALVKSLTPSPQPMIQSKPVTQPQSIGIICSSSYFTFKPNTVWNYQFTSNSTNKDGKKTQTASGVTLKITNVATGSATLELKLTKDTTVKQTSILCRTDGLYLNPLALAGSLGGTSGLLNMLEVKPILLIPADETKLHKGYIWESVMAVGINLGFINQNIQLPLVNTVISENTVTKSIIVQSVADVSKSDFGSLLKGGSVKLTYELQQYNGIVNASGSATIAPFLDFNFSLKRR